MIFFNIRATQLTKETDETCFVVINTEEMLNFISFQLMVLSLSLG